MRRGALALAVMLAGPLKAQVIPNARWKTLRTEHFRVHFTPELEDQGRRAAANAERAWTLLSAELHVPRGPVDLVVADNVDFTNGYARTSPSNRIVIYAHPPVHDQGLRFYDDWNALVITHELTHVFHLDRTRGWWRVAQRIFGRDPFWFPNAYLPAWLVEGLAVYEESRLTGAGRLAGSSHRMIARTSVLGGHLPRIDELSLGTSRFPGGGSVYAYGSLMIEFLARTHGENGVRKFVDRISGAPIPWLLNRQAKRSFGVSLEEAWREWRDSLTARPADASMPAGWRDLTAKGRYAFHPRWTSDSALVFVGSTGKDVGSAYRLDLNGRRTRIGRRSAFDPNVPVAGGLLYSQLDYTTPYEVRSDLWIQRGRREHRITHGARLSYADRRTDGRIVAVQATPGGTRLVTLNGDGRALSPITEGSGDAQWAEPRWSPDGSRIAALRLLRGATSSVVVIDTAGSVIAEVVRERAVIAGLSWSSDSTLLYSSDRTGITQLYLAVVGSASVQRLTSVATGLFTPELSPDGRTLAAVQYRSDGYHVGVAPFSANGESLPAIVTPRDTMPAAASFAGSATSYRPWRTLLPTYWRPIISVVDEETLAGAVTSGNDVIGKHEYIVQAQKHLDRAEIDGFAQYRYAGLGMPLLDVSFEQAHDFVGSIVDTADNVVGALRERSQLVSMGLTQLRPRMRTFAYVSLGASVELGTFTTEPSSLLDRLDPDFGATQHLRTLRMSGGWSNTQRPELSISSENGISVNGSGRVRHRDGVAGRQHSAVGILSGYRAMDLGAWAHHVLAVRTAAGVADRQSTSGFSAGGTSGEAIEILPGLSTNGGRETFGVRGFRSGTLSGSRALSVSAELRAPLFAPSRGYRLIPVFFDRSSIALFADGASAWCPEGGSRLFVCRGRMPDRRAIISTGLEASLDAAAIDVDYPYHLRIGVAVPVARRELASSRATAYFTLGTDF